MRYRTIVADPPWDYGDDSMPWRTGTVPHYPSMPFDQLAALPVASLATEDAHLYLWAVIPLMDTAYRLVEAWGFKPDTLLTWCKPGPGLGGGYRGNTEHLIVARRGFHTINPTCATCGGRARGSRKCGCVSPDWRHKGMPLTGDTAPRASFLSVSDGTWFTAPRGRHSEKPELFMDLIEQMSPGPRLEMFARRQRLGWDTWGNEAHCHVEVHT